MSMNRDNFRANQPPSKVGVEWLHTPGCGGDSLVTCRHSGWLVVLLKSHLQQHDMFSIWITA